MLPYVFEAFDDPGALHICRNMRRTDAAEIYAMRPEMDAWALYRDLATMRPAHLWLEMIRPFAQVQPVALFGVMGTSPGVGAAHLIGTPAFGRLAAQAVIARIQHVIIPELLDSGLHRVEALSLASYGWAHRFLRAAGAEAEGPPRRALGKAGEDFQSFVWLKDRLQPQQEGY